jgi:ProP effector
MTQNLEVMNRNHTAIAILAEAFPLAFFIFGKSRKPLAIGIDRELLPRVAVTEEDLRSALQYYTRSDGYLRACTEGASRLGLDGNAAGEVTSKEAAYAQRVIAKREKMKLKQTARRKQKTSSPQRISFVDLKAAAAKRRAAAG